MNRQYKEIKDIKDLRHGDIIKSKFNGISYTVIANFGERVTAVRFADLTNIIEWEVLRDNEPPKK